MGAVDAPRTTPKSTRSGDAPPWSGSTTPERARGDDIATLSRPFAHDVRGRGG